MKPEPSAAAGATTWTNGGLGEWSIAGNWNNGVPDATSFAYIGNGVTALVTTYYAETKELHIGGAAGNSTLLITNGGRLSKVIETYVGDAAGQTGTLTLENSADFWGGVDSYLIAGSNSLTHGTVNVNGAGSLVLMTNILIGDAGTASLTISNGAGILSAYAAIGTSPGGSGTVTVTGSGSGWENSGEFDVGGQSFLNGGSAYLNITAGAHVYADSLKVFSGGLVTVNNGSSTTAGLKIAFADQAPLAGGTLGDISIGDTTAGRMLIEGGGLALTRRGFIGQNAGVTGSVTVTGANSRWDCEGSVWSGNSGIGSLEITAGGVVASAGNGYLGFSTNSSGSAVVSGAGSSWTTAINLYVGGNGAAPGGPGTLQIENGGVVGAAAITVYNTGVLRLGVNPTLNGPLTFLGGSIQPVANTTFTKGFSLGSGGLVVQSSGFDLTLSGNISGTGGISKSSTGGSGTLKLTGNNTYSGATAINAGTLLVNGSITSATSVNSGGRLTGTGTVGTVTVNSGGTVVPGSSAGKLSFNGDYTQVSGGVLEIELGGYTPGSGYDQLAVTGQATIGGILKVTLINKFRPTVGDTFAIITSNSESGNFSSIISCGFTVQSVASQAGIVLLVTSVDPPPLVLNTNDSGPGSLRTVIANACPNSIITFAPNVRGAITLTSGELPITKNLTINGPGANLLSVQRGAAAGNFRIFNISPASITVTITGLTIADGKVPNGNGGGIANVASLVLGGVTLSGNTAQNGGGIHNDFGIVTISHSTLSGNSVSNAVFAGSGGAMFNSGGVVMIDHSTISGNSAIGPGGNSDSAGGIITNVGSVTLTNSTVTGNSGDIGGGIRGVNGGIVRAKSTLIALNTSPSGPDVNGPLTSDGFNLIGNAAGAVAAPALSSDQIGVTPAALNLGPLLDNGGPTKTHALLSNSVAVDKGHSNASFVDQRGLMQPLDLPGANAPGGDGADIGAFEYGSIGISPELQISRLEGGSVWLAVLGAPFTVYPLKFAPGLGEAWVGVGDVTADALGMGDFQHTPSDNPAPGLRRGFYRLEY
ncbi:choice-of-anchor Q domain-containing protein [Haloferula sp. BvORR071]|uniref:choice-of-anchor Q domain-containing protein n=1 Tax=Haloferula sp. BvORR071 TaxID=1396141 RepID=UPI002240FF8B|nr:choice-of-anchor Q domain-containing protein [Haloferula sp. BvORR071]